MILPAADDDESRTHLNTGERAGVPAVGPALLLALLLGVAAGPQDGSLGRLEYGIEDK